MRGNKATTGATLLGEPLPVELMNTIGLDRDRVRDALESDTDVIAWLRAVEDRIGADAGITLNELAEDAVRPVAGQVRELRDALRRLAAEMTEDPRPPATAPRLTRPDAITRLNTLAGAWPELVWPAGGRPMHVFRAAGTSVDVVVGLIAHQGVELFAGAGRERLRACLAPNCLLYFFKEHARREWCSPACGNRARVARHYQRHHVPRPD